MLPMPGVRVTASPAVSTAVASPPGYLPDDKPGSEKAQPPLPGVEIKQATLESDARYWKRRRRTPRNRPTKPMPRPNIPRIPGSGTLVAAKPKLSM
jgi:hypothetical protein